MKRFLIALFAFVAINSHAEILVGAYDDEKESQGTQFNIEWKGVNAEYTYIFPGDSKQNGHAVNIGGNTAFRLMESAPLFAVAGVNLHFAGYSSTEDNEDNLKCVAGIYIPLSVMYSIDLGIKKVTFEPMAGVNFGLNIFSKTSDNSAWIFTKDAYSWLICGAHAGLSFVYDKKYVLGARYEKDLFGLGGMELGDENKKSRITVSLGYRF